MSSAGQRGRGLYRDAVEPLLPLCGELPDSGETSRTFVGKNTISEKSPGDSEAIVGRIFQEVLLSRFDLTVWPLQCFSLCAEVCFGIKHRHRSTWAKETVPNFENSTFYFIISGLLLRHVYDNKFVDL